MKFQNPSLNSVLNGRKDGWTNERTSRKQYAPHFFKVGGIKKFFFWGGAGSRWGVRVDGGCEWRSEAFVKIQKNKIIFFWGGGGGQLGGGGVRADMGRINR